jgi:hypothetical protein
MIPPIYSVDQRVDILALARFQELSFICEFPLATSSTQSRNHVAEIELCLNVCAWAESLEILSS